VRNSYEIRAGRSVWVREAGSPMEALIEHLRSMGCQERDIIRLGTQSVSWLGAVYRASPAGEVASEAT